LLAWRGRKVTVHGSSVISLYMLQAGRWKLGQSLRLAYGVGTRDGENEFYIHHESASRAMDLPSHDPEHVRFIDR